MPFIGKSPQVGAFQLIDSITTSATDTYALTVSGSAYVPESARNLIVSLNGVTQAPETAYTVSGSNIVFASALTASDVIDYILVIGDAVDIGTPSDNTVGDAQLKAALDLSSKTLTFANDQISGDVINGGTISSFASTGIDDNATSTAITIDASENVGIGTASPSTSLDVVRAGAQPLRLQSTSGTECQINMVNTGGNVQLEAHSGNFTIDADNVGIGTTSPAQKLDVNGTAVFGGATTRLTTYSDSTYSGIFNGSSLISDEAIYMGSDSIFFYGGGTERMRIDANGNVGIGSTTPPSQLAGTNGLVIEQTTPGFALAGGSRTFLQYVTGTTWRMYDKNVGVDRITLNSSGNVGLGTTSPAALLHLNSNSDTYFIVGTTNATADARIQFRNSAGTDAGGLWYATSGNNMLFRTNSAERMRIDSSGNVILNNSAGSSDNTLLRITGGTAGYSTLNLGDTDDGNVGNIQYNHSTNSLAFDVNNTERMRIDSSGNVGIGTTNPVRPLHIHTTSNSQMQFTDNTSGSTDADGLRVGWNGTEGQVYLFENADLRFATNNAERMRIDSSGNVGIGVASAGNLLHIHEGSSAGSWAQFTNTTTSAGGSSGALVGIDSNEDFRVHQYGANAIKLYTSNTERMRITSSGSVGIGTTSPARELEIRLADDTTTTLGQKGGISLYAPSNTVANGGEITWASAVNGEVWAAISGHITSNGSGVASGDLVFGTGDNSALPTERMRITANGSVGIGTASPAYRLSVHVNAVGTTYPLKIENSNATSGNGVGLLFTHRAHSGDNQGSIEYVGAGANNTNSMLFKTEANGVNGLAERMRIDSSGNLLVGTTSPINSAHTFIKNQANNAMVINNQHATTPYGVQVRFSAANPNNTGSPFFEAYSYSGSFIKRFEVRSNGGIANYSSNNVNLSDQRAKKDIVNSGNYLEKLCNIPVRNFRYNEDAEDSKHHLGVIAQEVEAVAPEFVNKASWEYKDDQLDTVYNTDLMFAMMKSIQELSAQVNELKAEVAALKGA